MSRMVPTTTGPVSLPIPPLLRLVFPTFPQSRSRRQLSLSLGRHFLRVVFPPLSFLFSQLLSVFLPPNLFPRSHLLRVSLSSPSLFFSHFLWVSLSPSSFLFSHFLSIGLSPSSFLFPNSPSVVLSPSLFLFSHFLSVFLHPSSCMFSHFLWVVLSPSLFPFPFPFPISLLVFLLPLSVLFSHFLPPISCLFIHSLPVFLPPFSFTLSHLLPVGFLPRLVSFQPSTFRCLPPLPSSFGTRPTLDVTCHSLPPLKSLERHLTLITGQRRHHHTQLSNTFLWILVRHRDQMTHASSNTPAIFIDPLDQSATSTQTLPTPHLGGGTPLPLPLRGPPKHPRDLKDLYKRNHAPTRPTPSSPEVKKHP